MNTQEGKGDTKEPDCANVHDGGPQGIATAAEDAHHDAVTGRTDGEEQGIEHQQLEGKIQRFLRDVVHRQDEGCGKVNDETDEQAGQRHQQCKATAVQNRAFFVIAQVPPEARQRCDACVGK